MKTNEKKPLYADYNATTPLDPRVFDMMTPYHFEHFGNSSSAGHSYGLEASARLDALREQVLADLNAEGKEVVFTSGATESNQLLLHGICRAGSKRHILSQKTEHKSVLENLKFLEEQGHRITLMDVNAEGLVDLSTFESILKSENVDLVSIMHVNNETGVIQDLRSIGKLAKAHGAWFHSDGAQAIGKLPVDLSKVPVDAYTISGHKFYGPKGVGALVLSPELKLQPLLRGGGQEFGLRSGTVNLPGIAGLSHALHLAQIGVNQESLRLEKMRDRILDALNEKLEHWHWNGSLQHCVANTLSLKIRFLSANDLLTALPDLAIGSGAACSSGTTEPSHVIRAMTGSEEDALSTIRISLGRFSNESDVEHLISSLLLAIENCRRDSLEYEMHLAGKL